MGARGIATVVMATGLWAASAQAASFTLMFERTTDAGTGAELAFRTHASLADLFTNTISGPDTFSPINISANFDTTGLAAEWDLGEPTPVVEPATPGLLGVGLAGFVLLRRRRRAH